VEEDKKQPPRAYRAPERCNTKTGLIPETKGIDDRGLHLFSSTTHRLKLLSRPDAVGNIHQIKGSLRLTTEDSDLLLSTPVARMSFVPGALLTYKVKSRTGDYH